MKVSARGGLVWPVDGAWILGVAFGGDGVPDWFLSRRPVDWEGDDAEDAVLAAFYRWAMFSGVGSSLPAGWRVARPEDFEGVQARAVLCDEAFARLRAQLGEAGAEH